MIRLRLWIAATLGWLLFFYNIERFHEPINIASFVYVEAAILAMGVVALRPLRNVSPWYFFVVAVVILLVCKPLLNYGVFGPSLPLTVTEICALAITLILAHRIACSIKHFENSAQDVMTMQLGAACAPFEQGQADIYREVRRAREHRRPLSLVAISLSGKSSSVDFNKMLLEVQQNAVRQYLQGRLAALVAQATKDCDILVRNNDHFVLVLPESDGHAARDLIERLHAEARDELGLQLSAGVATFPDQEVTFSGLLHRAAEDMLDSGEVDTPVISPKAKESEPADLGFAPSQS